MVIEIEVLVDSLLLLNVKLASLWSFGPYIKSITKPTHYIGVPYQLHILGAADKGYGELRTIFERYYPLAVPG